MRVTCIYLAAGNSRRFGSNKLFYQIEGKPMYLHLLERLITVCERHTDWEVLVVTQYPELIEAVKGLPVRTVLSPDSNKGISYSIRAALAGAEDAEAYAFFVADQPCLREETAEGFLQKMEQNSARLGCVCHKGQSGNPVWFLKEFRKELLALTGDRGGKCVIKAHAGEVSYYEVADAGELCDIDSPAL